VTKIGEVTGVDVAPVGHGMLCEPCSRAVADENLVTWVESYQPSIPSEPIA
jgi:hypothetical protein